MTNRDIILSRFVQVHPEYKGQPIDVNIYGDILVNHKIVAIADIDHDLMSVGDMLPESWTIKGV